MSEALKLIWAGSTNEERLAFLKWAAGEGMEHWPLGGMEALGLPPITATAMGAKSE